MEINIKHSDDRVAVIGLGYVGLPLAVAFAKAGCHTIGVDLDTRKVKQINAGISYIPDVPTNDVAELTKAGQFIATNDYEMLRDRDAVFICVPTPYDAMRAPDLSFIISAAESIQKCLKHGQMIILQSTTYPGTTEEIVQPILERTGMKAGVDFDLAFSPERIDPGRVDFTVKNTPKVVGGMTPAATERATALLAKIGAPVHPVSSPRAAEMTKLLENIFRSVNIALVNELARMSERMNIDMWEVINAAKTKPYGYMAFTPSAGVGGHCIGVDPYYLSWKAREYDFYTRFIELAAEVNQSMPFHVVSLIERALGNNFKAINGSKVLVLGVSFKRDIDDARNSPAERVMELLVTRNAIVDYHDPYVPKFHIGPDVFHREQRNFSSQPLTEALLKTADCVVITTGHKVVDYHFVVKHARAVVDTCNATEYVKVGKEKILKLGSGVSA
ncbi:MAG: nucleotide sugar dehydrogenase [Chloroflexota bacterium]|jgi:UDP-N-acetyl-D-glucosamine dehydrogenase|nr:nucleotide sugar dehydrogenase [Chloroflexota bacterium]